MQLALLDAVVSDKEHVHVGNLAKDDFELRVDGKLVPLRQVVFLESAAAADTGAPCHLPARTSSLLSKRATTCAPDRVRQTLGIVVDDLGLSFESTVRCEPRSSGSSTRRVRPIPIRGYPAHLGRRRFAAAVHRRLSPPARRRRARAVERLQPQGVGVFEGFRPDLQVPTFRPARARCASPVNVRRARMRLMPCERAC